jgi:hypothetical protein
MVHSLDAMRGPATWMERLLVVAAIFEAGVALVVAITGGGQRRLGPLLLSATDATRPAIAACLLVAIKLLLQPPRRFRAVLVVVLAALAAALIVQSSFRRVGDGAEYVAMAVNLSRGSRPSLTPVQLAAVGTFFPGDTGFHLDMPELVGSDGRQDFPHFWLYSLLAAPLVRIAMAAGASPMAGFCALNVLLLAAALSVAMWRYGAVPTLFVVAGPVIWWIDKAHTEVMTVTVLTVAIALLSPAPWWSLVVLGVGAAQNPPLAAVWVIVLAAALAIRGLKAPRVWLGAAAGAAIAAVHPLYYAVRLGRLSGLLEGLDRHWPSVRELLTVLIDPNVGILVMDPFLAAALIAGLVYAWRRAPGNLRAADHIAAAGIGTALLVVFAQTTNFNSGGTPGPSRYGLWLLPLALPLLADVPERAAWWRVLAAASLVWCAIVFAPRRPDHYLEPTPLASRLWSSWPALDNPVAEIFAERVSGREPSPSPPIATRDCSKVLLAGRGGQPVWPERCQPTPAPTFCLESGALCYANRTEAGYSFSRAPSGPAWRRTHLAAGAGG